MPSLSGQEFMAPSFIFCVALTTAGKALLAFCLYSSLPSGPGGQQTLSLVPLAHRAGVQEESENEQLSPLASKFL